MNKIYITFFFLGIFSLVHAESQTIEFSKIWKRCKEQIIQYSNYMENVKKDRYFPSLFNCSIREYEIKKYCEDIYYDDQKDESYDNLRNQCLMPLREQQQFKCLNFNYVCASEIDKCKLCQQNKSCKTDDRMPKYRELQDIKNGIDTNCGIYKHSSYCDSTELTTIAYNSCKLYYIKKCSNEFYLANFEEDECYDEYNCIQSLLSTTYLKISLILLIAFFTY